MNLKYTVVVMPRHDSRGVMCRGLFNDIPAAAAYMFDLVTETLQGDHEYTDEEIDEYDTGGDSIDTPDYYFSIAQINTGK
jgi:hypothetical protein